MSKYHSRKQHPRSKNRSHKKYTNKSSHYRSRSRNKNNKKRVSKNYKRKRYTSSSFSSSSSSSSSRKSSYKSSYFASGSDSRSGSAAERRRTPHFRFSQGEKIAHKYKITRLLGDGTFGRVVQGKYNNQYFAIKIIKPVQKYIKSAKVQKDIVKQINQKDKDDKYGLVRYVENFYHHKNYCIVFKPLGKSLYTIIKKNQYKGFSKAYVKTFFKQILTSVGFMHKIGYTHTDLKPQNILLESDELRKISHYRGIDIYYQPITPIIRIIDFGGATKYNEHHSSVINTRQYRSPEVILQCCQWSQISDVWSIGCIIPQLYTGDLFFETHQDHEHLAMIQKNCGKFPKWMIKDCGNSFYKTFDRYGNIDDDYVRKYINEFQKIIGLKSIQQIFKGDQLLIDLLKKCLQVDPKKRISCEEALSHAYFNI